MYGEGGDLVDVDAQEITVNSAENVAGVQTAQDLVESGAAVKPDANDPYGTMMTLFKEGKVGMIINGPWEVGDIATTRSSAVSRTSASRPCRPAPPAGRTGRWPQLRHLLRDGRGEGRRRDRVRQLHGSPESQAFIADELGLLPGNADGVRPDR